MRSKKSHQVTPRTNPVLQGIVQAVSDVSNVLVLLGDLIASMTHAVKKTDHSEPPDAAISVA